MADDLIKRLNKDNVFAQRTLCGKCGMPMAQSPNGISDKNLVQMKGKKVSGDNKLAYGLMCGACLEHPRFSKEGPRNAITYNDATDEYQPVYYDNLLDYNEPKTEPTTTATTTAKTTGRK